MTRVLHLIPYMHPSAGGPPVVVNHWCEGLLRAGIQASVLTTDAYAGESGDEWIADYRDRYPMTVLPLRGPRGFGYSSTFRTVFETQVSTCDLVHVHNLWNYGTQLAAGVCVKKDIPFVVSSHGMLDPNSMGRKPWKKQLYGRLFEWKALRRAAGIVFTHAEEERLARETCPGLPVGYIVPLGTEEPPHKTRGELADTFLAKYPELQGRELVVFLSRLHPKKGLDLLLPAFREVLNSRPHAHLVLVGPGEPAYVSHLKNEVSRLGINERVLFTGSLSGLFKWGALAAGTVYVLPSYQENFAIALVEALRVGTPVVCSHRVNIWSDLASAGAATCCELSMESVASSILQLLSDSGAAMRQGERGARLASQNYTWEKSVQKLSLVYQQVLNADTKAFLDLSGVSPGSLFLD